LPAGGGAGRLDGGYVYSAYSGHTLVCLVLFNRDISANVGLAGADGLLAHFDDMASIEIDLKGDTVIELNGRPYELEEGRVFLWHVSPQGHEISQEKVDLPTLESSPPDPVAVRSYVTRLSNSHEQIRDFFQE
jgi:hypothetical protein